MGSSHDWLEVWAAADTELPTADLTEIVGRLHASALKERAAGPLVHDANNLLTAAQAEAGRALELSRAGLPPVTELERVCATLEQIAALTREYGAFGRPMVAPAPTTDVNARLESRRRVIDLMAGCRVTLELAPDLPLARIAPGTLDRLMLNAVANACDAAAGGDVTLVIRTACTTLEGRPRVLVSVEDDGPGMDEATARAAFRPTFTTKASGTGLGLPIIARAVARVGGRVRLRTRPGEGTAVDVLLLTADD